MTDVRSFLPVFGVDPLLTTLDNVAAAAVRAGYAVVPVEPGGKRPLCPLTVRQRNTADRAAQAEGKRKHACGVHHAITDPVEARRVMRRLAKDYIGPVNIGVVAGPSRVIIVDCDTSVEVEAFRGDMARELSDPTWLDRSPTVRTPGLMGDGDTWLHKDGGHFYFAVDEDMAEVVHRDVVRLHGAYDVKVGMSQAIVPPSTRPEGAYVCTGDVPPAPAWLLNELHKLGRDYAERRAHAAVVTANDAVATWASSITWAELLVPDGWTETGKVDACGCGIYTKPGGGRTSWKSATGHEADCPLWQNIEGHGPMHMWTTDPPGELVSALPPGQQTLTKLQYIAAMVYGGDTDRAMVGLGLGPDMTTWWPTSDSELSQAVASATVPGMTSTEPTHVDGPTPGINPLIEHVREGLERYGMNPAKAPEVAEEVKRIASKQIAQRLATEWSDKQALGGSGLTWQPRADLAVIADRVHEPITEGLLARVDGETLFVPGKVSVVFGQSEAGKSWLVVLAIKQALQAGRSALYIDFEDSPDTFLGRLREVGCEPRPYIASGVLGYASPEEALSLTAVEALPLYDLVAVDSMSEVVSQFSNGSVNDGSLVRRIYRALRALAGRGPAVVVIDHASEKGDTPTSTLGASEKRQAVDGVEVLVVNRHPLSRTGGGSSYVFVTKDRTGHTADDVLVLDRGPRSHRRLWGTLNFSPTVLSADDGDDISDPFRPYGTELTIELPEMPEPGPTRIEVAEQYVLTMVEEHQHTGVTQVVVLAQRPDRMAENTVRQAIQRLQQLGMIHVNGAAKATGDSGGKSSPLLWLGPDPTAED